jgi:hypothetical protein
MEVRGASLNLPPQQDFIWLRSLEELCDRNRLRSGLRSAVVTSDGYLQLTRCREIFLLVV